MIVIDGKECRNIQEQVQKNMDDISDLKNAIDRNEVYETSTSLNSSSETVNYDTTNIPENVNKGWLMDPNANLFKIKEVSTTLNKVVIEYYSNLKGPQGPSGGTRTIATETITNGELATVDDGVQVTATNNVTYNDSQPGTSNSFTFTIPLKGGAGCNVDIDETDSHIEVKTTLQGVAKYTEDTSGDLTNDEANMLADNRSLIFNYNNKIFRFMNQNVDMADYGTCDIYACINTDGTTPTTEFIYINTANHWYYVTSSGGGGGSKYMHNIHFNLSDSNYSMFVHLQIITDTNAQITNTLQVYTALKELGFISRFTSSWTHNTILACGKYNGTIISGLSAAYDSQFFGIEKEDGSVTYMQAKESTEAFDYIREI